MLEGQTTAEPVEVRRNGPLLGVVGLGAVALAVAYGWRSLDGSPLGLLVAVPLALLGAVFAAAAFDARSPVMVVDAHGVRHRDGRRWTGATWDEVESVTLTRQRRPWQDGRVDVRLVTGERVGTAVGLSAPVAGDVVDRLRDLAAGRAVVAEVVPAERVERPAALPAPAAAIVVPGPSDEVYDQELDPVDPVDEPAGRDTASQETAAPETAAQEPTDGEASQEPVPERADGPEPVRPAARLVEQAAIATRAIRANLTRSAPPPVAGTSALRADALHRGHPLPEARHLDPRADRPGWLLEPAPEPVEPEPVDGPPPVVWTPEVPEVAVIGQRVGDARRRLGLSVDSVAERTRIRAHVIESIEVDDFAPCGGDFYARGHLRSLARVLGLDADALVEQYDELYAQAPVGAARVFEAELATGPAASIRLTTGGPNWGALLGLVMVVAIVWGLGHLLTDEADAPARAGAPTPTVAASEPAVDPDSVAGLGAPTSNRLVLRGRGEPTRVVVKDSEGQTVWSGRLADGDSATVRLVGRGTIVAADGGVVAARVNQKSLGRLGEPGERVERPIGKR